MIARLRLAAFGSVACILVGCTGLTERGESAEPAVENSESTAEAGIGEVEWVIDGDTVDLIIDGQQERVRLIGVDTPETVSRDVPVQCFGAEASDALRGLLPVGSTVRLVRDEEARDRFGRLLLYLYRTEDSLFVNQALIDGGFADALFFKPNTFFEADFTTRRNAARENGVGLWGACDGPDQSLE